MNTRYIRYFNLKLYEYGFVLMLPSMLAPTVLPEPLRRCQSCSISLADSSEWGKRLDLETVGALNDKIAAGDMSHLILIQEALQENGSQRSRPRSQSAKLPNRYDRRSFFLWERQHFPIGCPIQLEAIGLKPHPIAVDNYFVNRVDSPRDENGNYNYEILECLDVRTV